MDSQVDSLDAMTKDLKAEASFFNDTALEAAVGFTRCHYTFSKEFELNLNFV